MCWFAGVVRILSARVPRHTRTRSRSVNSDDDRSGRETTTTIDQGERRRRRSTRERDDDDDRPGRERESPKLRLLGPSAFSTAFQHEKTKALSAAPSLRLSSRHFFCPARPSAAIIRPTPPPSARVSALSTNRESGHASRGLIDRLGTSHFSPKSRDYL